MANVPHSSLTGADLHESKGVAAAAVDTVFVTDGAGSGIHKKLPLTALAPAANSFGGQLMHLQDSKASGTNGQGLTYAVWNTRALQTVKTNEITSASLSSNQITLPAGTYFIHAETCWNMQTIIGVQVAKLKLQNITAGATALLGKNAHNYAYQNGYPVYFNAGQILTAAGRLTIATTTVFELQHWVNIAGSVGGTAAGIGENEIYTDVFLWKVA